MKLQAFRDVEAAIVAIQDFCTEVFDNQSEGADWELDTMERKDKYPELAKAIRRMERTTGHYEFGPTLRHAEEALGGAKDVIDLLDTAKNHFDSGDPYGPDAIRAAVPELAAKIKTLRTAMSKLAVCEAVAA